MRKGPQVPQPLHRTETVLYGSQCQNDIRVTSRCIYTGITLKDIYIQCDKK